MVICIFSQSTLGLHYKEAIKKGCDYMDLVAGVFVIHFMSSIPTDVQASVLGRCSPANGEHPESIQNTFSAAS